MEILPDSGRRAEWAALAAAAVTVVLWASAFVSIRSASAAYSPGALALGRLLAGTVVLGAISLVRRVGWPPRAAWPGIAGSGVLWFGLYMVVLNWGEREVDAGTAAMVVNVGPILIALLSSKLLGEELPRPLLLGMAVSFAGAVVVGISMSGDGHSSVLGVLLCLLAAVSYAGGVVAQKPALRHAGALQATTFGCLVGALACLPFAGSLVSEVARAPWPATANMLYLGVFPTALAFTTWAFALARTSAGRMGATTYVVPVLVVLMSWLALDEVPGALTLAGGALCLAGVAVSRYRPSRRKTAAVTAENRDGATQSSAT
ncbi:DMT family transporter [Streptoalloteichus hindustanus]|uniref:Permease of the drug/metabolite transporter (DMT) superfamily n=1 Tax=Streptoalloteichus hindustanus TaxID=2017 RepID=A0A1M5EXI9_STRHI|nr:DMT family transporter [Streptoalloteichus hindustanus]SHF83751.1 Permease of the drug/metabolite transporter (DMT) superfamily [Streptoalloteichus hindustanus]